MVMRLLSLCALAICLALPVAAQNMFTPVAKVNNRVVTQYELTQRTLFYRLLRAPGDIRQLAMDKLVEERLQLDAALAMGIEVTDEEIQEGLAEFAGRANLTPDQFLTAVGQAGIAPETVFEFIRAGVAWRGVVRGRFGPRAEVSEAEIDRALATASAREATEQVVAIEFARFFIPGGRTERNLAEAARIGARVDTCDDLYGVAKGLPQERLLRDTLPIEQISGDIAAELSQLDEGEYSTNLTTGDGGALVFLMMCGRTLAISEEVDREQARQQLFNARLASYANGYLEELKAGAFIEYQ